MKKSLFITCLCFSISFYLSAQNTFPASGNVGIGISTPNYLLDVISSDFVVSKFSRSGSSGGASLQIDNASGTGSWQLGVGSNNHFGIYKNNGSLFGQQLIIQDNGNVGIGTTTPDSKLTVKGNIHTNEVKVDLLGAIAPDYVFYKDYDLKTLQEVENYISEKGHLPNIPSAKDMEDAGIKLKEMNLKLLEKIEELTLYTINQEKKITVLKNKTSKVETLEKELQKQNRRLQKLEVLLSSKKR
ncbi:tail fiber protein [Flavivirga jejuensis]|uniref:Tail fiber protein n=1 Tax=Flavivirga jejuensis TaxID=870487 RepID=A0ABT8WMX5_9FLAO|nr:tail fiber protein [Flavivirga jejuensis]MDO5974506.1 tail fiber protein [Flavivirga jejuensis]